MPPCLLKHLLLLGLLAFVGPWALGCHNLPSRNLDLEAQLPGENRPPNELDKTALPPYVVEPPDVLLIDAVKVVPKPPYRLEALDVLQIRAQNVLPDHPLDGLYQIEAAGTVNLGIEYGSVKVVGMTVEQATEAIVAHLKETLRDPDVIVSLAQTAGAQQIAGQHLVAPDGTVNLGSYGQVYVAGMTLEQAQRAIEKHLEQFLLDPEITVDVFAYNSKVYYLITEGAGSGDQVTRLPIQGGETVLDAISQVGGLSQISTKQIWIARPAPDKLGYEQILPVNWNEITSGAMPATNWQVLPGDRIFIKGNPFIRIDNTIATITAPFERVSGFILLGSSAIRNLNGSFRQNFNNSAF